MNASVNNQDAVDVISLGTILDEIFVRRWWVAFVVLISTLGFTIASFLMDPVYRAAAVVISASEERNSLGDSLSSALGQLGGLANLGGIDITANDTDTQEALAVLRSRWFTGRFIDELSLMPRLFESDWDPTAGNWRANVRREPTPAKAFRLFDEKIRTLVEDSRTGIVTVQIEWKDRHEAAMWANELVQRLNSEMRSRAIEQAEASIDFLERELESTAVVATREAINRLIEGQIQRRMLASVTPEFSFRFVDKAMAPDSDDPVRPQKALLGIAGFFLGLLIALFWVLVSILLRSPPPEHLPGGKL